MLLEAARPLTVEELRDPEDLVELQPEWSALWARCPAATPFLSPEWLLPWWKHLGEGHLRTLAFRAGGALVGLAPLYLYQRPASSIRELFLIGIGTTDYLDVLFEPAYEAMCLVGLAAHLEATAATWDVCDFQQLRSGSPLRRLPALRGWADRVTPGEACPILPILPGTRDLEACVPRRMQHNLRYYQRRAEKRGRVRYERAERENLHELFDALLRLHEARWSTRGEPGVLADPHVQRAHREALPGLLELGALRLYALRLDDRIVASFYGFADPDRPGKRVYYYLGGFDPELEELSLGTLLIGHAVREAVREGAAAFDFLRGSEGYKYLWGAQDQETYRRRLWHASDPR